jgi:ABC-2 type transport system ATP-binding protein
VLFLDEPASALDPAGRKEVLDLIEQLRGQCTVFMSTHILADVERVCDHIGIVNRGRLVVQAPRARLLAQYAVPAFALEAEPGSEAALGAWAEAQRAQPWVAAITIDGPAARVTVRDLPAARQALLASAVAAGLTLTRYAVVQPSLEEIFLRLVNEN